MSKPLLSIIIATYNAEKHLSSCLESIRKQNTEQIQLIIIDGASKDQTLKIIRENDSMIDFFLSEPDAGVYDAMNKGIKYSKGDWVLFLGADDLLQQGFNNMLRELKSPNTIYYGMVDVGGTIYKDAYSDYRLSKMNICHQTILYPITVFNKYKYDLNFPVFADWALNIQCWTDAHFKFEYKPHLVSKFGIEGISSTITDVAFEHQRSSIIFKSFGLFTWLRFNFRMLKQKLSRTGRKPN